MASKKRPELIQTSGELFESVQQNEVFDDSKQFVDMIPTEDPDTILSRWKEQREQSDFDLKAFIMNHFRSPETPDSVELSDESRSCREHIQSLWPSLFRDADDAEEPHSSLIPLPYPYVVPGGRFQEIYYWDSYFTARGLLADGHDEMALNMLKNFRHMVKTLGHIPNGNREYYRSRSQPPFFVPMIAMLDDHLDEPVAEEFYDSAVTEYRFWMDQSEENSRRFVSLTDSGGQEHNLNRYWDDNPSPREESWREDVATYRDSGSGEDTQFYRHIRAACESGWDFSSRWLEDGKSLASIDTTNIIPIDLNTLLWFAEKQLAEWSKQFSKPKVADAFSERADRRKATINKLMWSNGDGFYVDYHLEKNAQTGRLSLAAVYPLYFKMADQQQAEGVAQRIKDDFLKDGGLLTTTAKTGQQWDAPNGWAPLQWLAVVGLRHYGFDSLAEEITGRWLNLNKKVYQDTGKMVEKYNVIDIKKEGGGGEYPLQDGFGWTNGVFSALSNLDF